MTKLPERFLTLPIAHRALHDVTEGRPENSLPAIRAAIAAGYCIEIDIQLSSDAQAMVFHDYDLRRLTPDSGSIQLRSAEVLTKTRLRGSKETIPTLDQVLKMVAGKVPVLIEIKDHDGALGPDTRQVEQAIADHINDYRGDVAVMSFNPHSVALMSELLPNVACGLVTGSFRQEKWLSVPESTLKRLRSIPDYDRVGASFISHKIDDLDRRRVADLRANGTPVLCWTVKDQATEIKSRVYADNITFEGYLPTRYRQVDGLSSRS